MRRIPVPVLCLVLLGCPKLTVPNPIAGLQDSLRVGFTSDSHVHAFQSYSFVYSFANGNAASHLQALERIRADGLPLFEKLAAAGMAPRLVVRTMETPQGIVAYGLDLEADIGSKTVVMPGMQGADPEAWHGGAAAIAAAAGLTQAEVEAGHGAWYHLTLVLTGLDAEAHTLGSHAFALQVMRERVEAGEQADWFSATRPPAETIADVEHAQALLYEDVQRVRLEQGAILASVALANHIAEPGVADALREEFDATTGELRHWQATHRQPTPEDFGVEWQMPDPRKVQAALKEQLGVVGAAIDVARGVATGNIPATLDGLAALAPKDSKVRTIGEGLAAASRGDIGGTISAIADLGGPETKVGRLAARLELVAKAADLLP